jgi:hypothetical protein
MQMSYDRAIAHIRVCVVLSVRCSRMVVFDLELLLCRMFINFDGVFTARSCVVIMNLGSSFVDIFPCVVNRHTEKYMLLNLL